MKEKWLLRNQETKRTIRIVFSTPAGIVGALIVIVLLLAVFLQPLLAPHDPYLVDIGIMGRQERTGF